MIITSIDLADAQRLIEAATSIAAEHGVKVAVTVTDPSGILIAFARMDGARHLTIESSRRKAVTSGGLMAPTHGIAQMVAANPGLAASFAAMPEVCLLGGGFPIMMVQECVGGLGIAGGQGDQDQRIGEQTLTRFAAGL